MKSLGLVTSFVDPYSDLKRAKGPNGNVGARSADVYVRLFEELHRSVPLPMAIYVTSEHIDKVTGVLARFPKDAPRFVIRRDFLVLSEDQDLLEKLRTLQPMDDRDPTKDTPEFAVATYGKVSTVTGAADVLKTSHLGWVDFGIAHIAELPTEDGWRDIESEAPDAVRLVQIQGTSKTETENLYEYYRYNRGRIDAGFFTGAIEHMQQFREEMSIEIRNMLETGRYVLEEQLMASLTTRLPVLFDVCYAGYAGALSNYINIRRDLGTVFANLTHCRTNGHNDEATRIVRALIRSAENRAVQLDEYACAALLSDGFICAYYSDPGLATQLARTVSALYNYGNGCFRGAVDRQPFRSNLPFVKESLDSPTWSWEDLSRTDTFHVWSRCL